MGSSLHPLYAPLTTDTTRISLDFRLVPGGCYDDQVEEQPKDFRAGEYYSEAVWREGQGFEVSVRGAPYQRHGFPFTNR